MHLAKLEYSPSEPEDADALLCFVIGPCWLLREPAHAAASRARPTAAMIAAGVRAAGRHPPRGRRLTSVLSPIARQRRNPSCAGPEDEVVFS
jgi:hypothetical protein